MTTFRDLARQAYLSDNTPGDTFLDAPLRACGINPDDEAPSPLPIAYDNGEIEQWDEKRIAGVDCMGDRWEFWRFTNGWVCVETGDSAYVPVNLLVRWLNGEDAPR